ncbi:hypothetical protein NP233_g3903 [Leucocoprinus birnbaumii]|uniref:Nephrocystin 3-like N-terminal domain-containing protein n=1 Tax=Leucocoprinus birnbaumii TaxID=56174 RepID=A0AAD5YTG9_9AGAR|nr:hypothetical protein NP233_g3903 [Leucocoprinus birnbaumii]
MNNDPHCTWMYGIMIKAEKMAGLYSSRSHTMKSTSSDFSEVRIPEPGGRTGSRNYEELQELNPGSYFVLKYAWLVKDLSTEREVQEKIDGLFLEDYARARPAINVRIQEAICNKTYKRSFTGIGTDCQGEMIRVPDASIPESSRNILWTYRHLSCLHLALPGRLGAQGHPDRECGHLIGKLRDFENPFIADTSTLRAAGVELRSSDPFNFNLPFQFGSNILDIDEMVHLQFHRHLRIVFISDASLLIALAASATTLTQAEGFESPIYTVVNASIYSIRRREWLSITQTVGRQINLLLWLTSKNIDLIIIGKSDGGETTGVVVASNESSGIQASKTINTKQEASKSLLLGMWNHIMHGVAFDSPERDPPPRCYPGTRSDILEQMIDRVADPEGETRLMWLHGPPGVGKSAILQTLVEVLSTESQRLVVALFLSIITQRINHIFPTIANQLADHNPSYRSCLAHVLGLAKTPALASMSLEDQLRFLFLEPFIQKKGARVSRCVIVIDGLGERSAARLEARERAREAESVIISLISKFVHNNPALPLVWIISSRSNNLLPEKFSPNHKILCEFALNTCSQMVDHDIETFLRGEIEMIRRKSSHPIIEEQWPDVTKIQQMAKACSGSFLAADLFVRVVGNPYAAHPIRQIDYWLAAISQSSQQQGLPGVTYAEILACIPQEALPAARKILGLILAGNHIWREFALPFRKACELLHLSWEQVKVVFYSIHPFICYSRIQGTQSTRPRFYHDGFMESMTAHSQPTGLSMTIQEVQDIAAVLCLRSTLQGLMIQTPEVPLTPQIAQSDRITKGLKVLETILRSIGPTEQLQPILKDLDFNRVARISFATVQYSSILNLSFLYYLPDTSKRVYELICRGIVIIVPYSSLGICDILSTHVVAWNNGRCIVDLGSPAPEGLTLKDFFHKSQSDLSYDDLGQFLDKLNNTKFVVWGGRKRCAVNPKWVPISSSFAVSFTLLAGF